MTWLIVSLAWGAVVVNRTIHALRSRVNVLSTCTSKLCSGVLGTGNGEHRAGKVRNGGIAHA